MRRRADVGAELQVTDQFRLALVGYVQDDQASIPPAPVRAVAANQRMVQCIALRPSARAVRLSWRPGRRFARACVLAGEPPAANFARPGWLGQVDDDQELIDEAFIAPAHISE